MDHHPPACSTHRTLVTRALADDPPDEVLERYATEVAECPECRRALAVHLGVHPGAIERGDPTDLAGMSALLREIHAPPSRPRVTYAVAAVALASMAALVAWMLVRPLVGPGLVPGPAPEPDPGPAVATAPTVPNEPAPIPVSVAEETVAPPAPRASTPVVDDDAVAMVLPEDWPPPPFEDLRGTRTKDVAATVRAAQLVLSGTSAVGQAMALTVVTSTPTALAVCVEGPERGVVWRGAVDAGRTELTRGGRPLAFAFAAPGAYRFLVSAGDTELSSCADPIHVVEVEVAG